MFLTCSYIQQHHKPSWLTSILLPHALKWFTDSNFTVREISERTADTSSVYRKFSLWLCIIDKPYVYISRMRHMLYAQC